MKRITRTFRCAVVTLKNGNTKIVPGISISQAQSIFGDEAESVVSEDFIYAMTDEEFLLHAEQMGRASDFRVKKEN